MTDVATIQPGVYPSIAFPDYLRIEAASATLLKHMERSPAYARMMAQGSNDSTPAQMTGSAAHAAILEPDLFASTYVRWDQGDLRSNANKAAWAAIEDAGQTPLKAHDYDRVQAIAESVRSHKECGAILRKATGTEVTLVWEDKHSGVLCKGRLDAHGQGFVADLKTTRDLPGFSPWTITRERLYRQAAFYLDGAKALGLDAEKFFWLAVANDAPYEAALYLADVAAIEAGREECRQMLHDYAACLDSGEWPGGVGGIQVGEITDGRLKQIFPEQS